MTVTMATEQGTTRRLYVGNLFPEVTENDLKEKFGRFGEVSSVEIKTKQDMDGNILQTFAFVGLLTANQTSLTTCINTLSNAKWRGYTMRIQQAKESFMARLARERQEKEERFKSTSQEQLNYDPLLTLKNRVQDTATGEPAQIERRGNRFLGGDRRRDEAEEVGQSSFHRGQQPHTGHDADSAAFLGAISSKRAKSSGSYDPMNLLKNRVQGDEEIRAEEQERTVEEGKVHNGVVTFDDGEPGLNSNKIKKKVYYSSSEEEEKEEKHNQKTSSHTGPDDSQTKKKAKKVGRTKEELRQKWEREQAAKKEMEQARAKKGQGQEGGGGGRERKRYYSSSEEEEDKEAEQSKALKTGLDVMRTFESFSSSVWADDENQLKKSKRSKNVKETEAARPSPAAEAVYYEEEPERDYDEMEAVYEDEENFDVTETKTFRSSAVKRKEASRIEQFMPRFDPDAAELPEMEQKDVAVATAGTTLNKSANFTIADNLKAAFSQNRPFSFGFLGSSQEAEEEEEASSKEYNKQAALFRLDSDDEGPDEDQLRRKIKPRLEDDFSSKFGRQLKSKSANAAESFFFSEDDPRLADSLEYFFGSDRPDPDQVRATYQEQRPVLAAILKKKARSRAKLSEAKKRKQVALAQGAKSRARRGGAKDRDTNFRRKKTGTKA